MSPSFPTTDELVAGIRARDRSLLARAITLVESGRATDRERAHALLDALLPENEHSIRIGVSGPPGVGKSTFIEALGLALVERGKRVGVLAVDPSSTVSGGSILGDKARMERLSLTDGAFIRPSPSARELGGVARRSREALLVLEAAGFDVLLVETVGVGQSEVLVHTMTDHFLVLAQPGSGDELQGIKRGILELANVVCVHKADGEREPLAREAATQLSSALRIARGGDEGWSVHLASSLEAQGHADVWTALETRDRTRSRSGEKAHLRAEQRVRWMHRAAHEEVTRFLATDSVLADALASLEAKVKDGLKTPARAESLVRAQLERRE